MNEAETVVHSRSHWEKWGLWASGLLVGYVLSIGPMGAALVRWDPKCYTPGGTPDRAFRVYHTFYAPLGAVANQAKWIEEPLTAYQEWWEKLLVK